MAFKDLSNYYLNFQKSYFKLLSLLEDYDARHKEGTVTDKEFKQFEKKVQKFKAPYETLAYFFTLWSRPDEKEKRKLAKWEKKHKKTYDYLAKRVGPDKIIKQNEKLFTELNAYIEKLDGGQDNGKN